MIRAQKLFQGGMLLAVLSLFVIGAPPAPVWAAEEIIIKFTDTHPLTHDVSTHGHQPFQKRVEELTGGKVKFKHFPAEQLGKEKDFVELARKGIVDIIYSGGGQQGGKMPLHAGCDL
ncbi:MAG: hypothetical protein NTY64_00205, partial [Deltaproteobacteria bacterium]|nr:hypothetical protein [Deltaproteobacteria bacterium]